MENPELTKDDYVQAEAPKPKLLDKLKGIRWTFKLKNNLTEYVTVEPLILFYMFQIFVVSLTLPYQFHKACLSLDQDTYFCDVMTTNENEIYQPCAIYESYYYYTKIHCKGLSEKTREINCYGVIGRYENNETKLFVKPEDYRFCKVVEKTLEKLYYGTIDSLVGISVIILTFLVVMIVSIWSDKYSKRKICLILPILGQLIITLINLHGALSTYFSFEFIKTVTMYIEALSGGMALFLFGCFSYMNNDVIRHKLLLRFGIIALILIIYRYIPILYNTVYQYYHDDDSYISLISLSLVFNIVCLLYVKVILNECKTKEIVTTAPESTSVVSNGKASQARHSKRKSLAKAFSLDVMWDYILIVFKKRNQSGRLIIILFLSIVFLAKMSPFDGRIILIINENASIDIADIDGGIFVLISILMLLMKISDVVIAILVMGIPILARSIVTILGYSIFEFQDERSTTDFYSPFKRLASCSLLLTYVDKNESRIFLIVQAVASLPAAVFQTLTSKEYSNIIDVVHTFTDGGNAIGIMLSILYILSVVVLSGLGLLYMFVRKSEQFKTGRMQSKSQTNFQIKNETDKNQPTSSVFNEVDEDSTFL